MAFPRLSRLRWQVPLAVLTVYAFVHAVHNYNNRNWLPAVVQDPVLKKKTVDGPLILREGLFDDGSKKSGRILQGAAILGDAGTLFDAPISKVKEVAPGAIATPDQFLKKFRKTARKAATAGKDFVLFTVINKAYYNLTSNFLCNLHTVGGERLMRQTLIVALEEQTCSKLVKDWPKLNCVSVAATDAHNRDLNWGKKAYVQILTFRARLLKELTMLNIEFVLFESDSVWLRNPIELFKNATAVDDADLVVPVNGYPGKQTLAFDPLVVFNTQAAGSFFRELDRRLQADATLMDQEVLNDLCSSQFNGTVCRTFEWAEVADGKWFKMGERERKQFRPFVVNNNYYVGVRNKNARQALNGMWFLTPKGACNVAKARKQLKKFQ